jgi:hypothetical protein
MKNKLFNVLLVFFLTIALGCGTSGKKFAKLQEDKIQFGTTTYEDIVQIMGEPLDERMYTHNEHQFKLISYSFASVDGESTSKSVVASRAQVFYFYEGFLVGHEFVSSWLEDHTNFDETKTKQISKGESTKADVITLLGHPCGRYIYPLAKNKGEEIIIYQYVEGRRYAYTFEDYKKKLLVEFDQAGIVKDVNYFESGRKPKSP